MGYKLLVGYALVDGAGDGDGVVGTRDGRVFSS